MLAGKSVVAISECFVSCRDSVYLLHVMSDARGRTTQVLQYSTNELWIQMSGAELPCGSILRVEPADPQYKQRQSEQKKSTKCDEDVGHYGSASGESTTEIPKKEVVEVNVSSTKGNGDENNQDDDLDDFFDSL